MENKTYSITLADDTVIGDLKLNGNNFISKSPIAKEIFEDCCSPVEIKMQSDIEYIAMMAGVEL